MPGGPCVACVIAVCGAGGGGAGVGCNTVGRVVVMDGAVVVMAVVETVTFFLSLAWASWTSGGNSLRPSLIPLITLFLYRFG